MQKPIDDPLQACEAIRDQQRLDLEDQAEALQRHQATIQKLQMRVLELEQELDVGPDHRFGPVTVWVVTANVMSEVVGVYLDKDQADDEAAQSSFDRDVEVHELS